MAEAPAVEAAVAPRLEADDARGAPAPDPQAEAALPTAALPTAAPNEGEPSALEKDSVETPPVPPGAFVATTEMLSLAGCSAEGFAEILKGLRYRPQTEKLPDGSERVLWRAGRPRPARADQPRDRDNRKGKPRRPRKQSSGGSAHQNGALQPADATAGAAQGAGHPSSQEAKNGPHKGKRPKRGKGQSGQPSKGKGQRPPRPASASRREPDPNSPFAVLAQLKDSLKSQ